MSITYQPLPTAQDVAEFLGQGGDDKTEAMAAQSLLMVTAMAKSYTRGNGFNNNDVSEDIAAVIITATARLMSNPTFMKMQSAGSFQNQPGAFLSWSLVETFVLNRYRKRAQ